MKKRKNGFTLIELLVTIIIISIVLTISIIGITASINKTKNKSILITKTNVLSSAQNYIKENYNNNDWYNITDEQTSSKKQYTCVSIEQLKSYGYLDKNVDDENFSFIIFKRDKGNKNIYYKNFANENEDFVCNKSFIIKPTFITKKTYTNHITTEYKISSELINSNQDENTKEKIRKLEVNNIKLNGKNYDYDINILDYEENYLFSKLVLNFDNLEMAKDYKLTADLIYTTIDENSEEKIKIETIENLIKTEVLNKPVIIVEKDNEWKKAKNVEIKFDTSNIYEEVTPKKYFTSNNIIDNFIIDNDDKILSCNENYDNCNEVSLENNKLINNINYRLDTNKQVVRLKIIDNDTSIKTMISDGTNTVEASKIISKIDNHEYGCFIEGEYDYGVNEANLSLKVKDNSKYPNNIDSEIVKKYKWVDKIEGETEFQEFNGKTNLINNKLVKKFGEYKAIVLLRTGESITCKKTIVDVNAPDINVEIYSDYELKKMVNIEDDKWYSGIYYVKIYTNNENSKISYCITNSDESCDLKLQDSSGVSINLSKSDKIKILAQSIVESKNSESILKTKNLWLDNDKPTIPTSKIYKINDLNKDITSTFKPHEDSWKNYSVRWSDFLSKDNHSGIEQYEYSINCTDKSNLLGVSTDYSDGNNKICIRSKDNVGNYSNWSQPYYFKIDTKKPKITINVYKRNSDNEKTGEIVASMFDVTDENLNTYANHINGWLNKENYPDGVYYDINVSDNVSLSKRKWEYNSKGLRSSSVNVDILDHIIEKDFSGTNENDVVTLSEEGFRKAKYTVIDSAGNSSTVNIIAPIDITKPSITMKAYPRLSDEDSNMNYDSSQLLNSISQVSEATINNYNGKSWVNFINGIQYIVMLDDNLSSSVSRKWYWNDTNLASAKGEIDKIKILNNESSKTTYKLPLNINGENFIHFYLDAQGERRGKYVVWDEAGNESYVNIEANIDKVKPTITINAYKRTSDDQKTGSIVASVSKVTSGTINASSYVNNVSGWLNKNYYPDGIYYDVILNDNYSLSSKKWEYNPYGLKSTDSNINNYTTVAKSSSGISDNIAVTFSGQGYRKGKYTVTDSAGNSSTVNIIAAMDKSEPTVSIILKKLGNKSATGNDFDAVKTTYNSYANYTSGTAYSYGTILAWVNSNDSGISGIKNTSCTTSGAENKRVSSSFTTYRNFYYGGKTEINCISTDNAGNKKEVKATINNTHVHEFGDAIGDKKGLFPNYIVKNYDNSGTGTWPYQWCNHSSHKYDSSKKVAYIRCIHCGRTTRDLNLVEKEGVWWCPIETRIYGEEINNESLKNVYG